MTAIILHLFREGLLLAVLLSVPPLAAAWLADLAVASVQRAAKIPEAQGLTHAPQFIAATIAMVIAGPWTVSQLVAFARTVFDAIAQVGS